MQFSLLRLLLSFMLFSAFLGYVLTAGLSFAIVFAVLAALTWGCVARLRSRWHDANVLQRVYATATVIGSSALLVLFTVGVATNSTLACERNERQLRAALSGHDEFANISVEYQDLKRNLLRVDGTVSSSNDFNLLRNRVRTYDWPGMDDVDWNVIVSDTGVHHHSKSYC